MMAGASLEEKMLQVAPKINELIRVAMQQDTSHSGYKAQLKSTADEVMKILRNADMCFMERIHSKYVIVHDKNRFGAGVAM